MNPQVDKYIRQSKKWQSELTELRRILLACPLTESFKWRAPCYTFENKNVAILGELKAYCVLGFFKGSLLLDPEGILKKPGENTQAARMVRFTSVKDIAEMEPLLRTYIREAIEVEKAGLTVEFKEKSDLVFPPEFQNKLRDNPELKTAFEALTPGRQRAYNLYFSGAKQSQTREARIGKCLQRILNGKGLTDR